MKNVKLFVGIVIGLLSALRVAAYNTDSVLDASVKIPRPYVVLNITSTDCIACRSIGMAILKSLRSDRYKDKIIILSDDKAMGPYFRQNSDIYGKYPVMYNRKLSAALAGSALSTVSLVQRSGVHNYLFNNVTADTLTYMAGILNVAGPSAQFTIPDSLLSQVSDVQYSGKEVLLVNDRVQLGLLYNRTTGKTQYLQPAATDAAADAVYDKFRATGVRGLSNAKDTRRQLGRVGMSLVTICRADMQTGTAMFRLFCMRADTTITGTDTNVNLQMHNPILMARGLQPGADPLNIASYTSCLPIDSIHFDNKRYMASVNMGYETNSGHVLFPFCNSDNCRKTLFQGKEVSVQTDICIASLNVNDRSKLKQAWPVAGYDAMEASLVFFRLDAAGNPLIINNSGKKLVFPENGLTVPFSKLNYGGDTVSYLYEVVVADSVVQFAAQTTKLNTVKGSYNFKTDAITIDRLDASYSYFRINGDELLACKKEEDEDVWHVSLFRL